MTRESSEPEEPPIRIKDSRKIDPVTGKVRNPAGGSDSPAGDLADAPATDPEGGLGGAPEETAQLLEERTRDLQRVSAEYANYRKRADRERLAAGELAVGRTLQELLPVLDDLDRANAHGDLTGGLKAIADKLTAAFDKLGLVSFGEVGDEFDPSLHEAVLHEESDSVSVPTCTTVMRVGYRHGERLLRAAMVGVTDPVHPAAPTQNPVQADTEAGPADTAGDEAMDGDGSGSLVEDPTES